MVVQAAAASIPLDTLASRTMLTSFPIGLWRGIKSDKRVRDAGAAHFGATPEMLNASRHLVASASIKALEAKRAAYRAEWTRLTAPWLDDGTRICLGAGFIPLKQKISAFEDEWRPAVAEFVREYPYLREDARRSLGPLLFNVNDYPDPNTMAARFPFTFRAWCVPNLNDWRADGVSQADLDVVRQQTAADFAAAFGNAQADAWTRLREPIAKMAESLRAYTGERKGSFQHTLVSNLSDILDTLPLLNITGDPTLDGIAMIARQLTLHSAEDLRQDESTRADTASLAEQLTQQIDQFI